MTVFPPSARRRRVALRFAACLVAPAALAASPPADRGAHAMVVGPEVHAVRVGREVLRSGGNAVDAAVATTFALAVTYPLAAPLGGGGFLLYRDGEGRCHALDFRETAPAALTPERFLDEEGRPIPGASRRGGLAVGVPGTVAGLAEAHRRWGSRPWGDLLAPAVRLADEGFPISRREAANLAERGRHLLDHAAAREIFTRDGRALAEGARLEQPDLAATLRRIAREGPRAFYEGPVADAIVATVRDSGGVMTAEDLRGYRPAQREPLVGSYRGHRVIAFPPPSSGGVVLLQILGMLEGYDLRAAGFGSSLTVHRIAEAARRAYADRSRWLGDPDSYDAPVAGLLDPEYLRRRASTIRDRKATPSKRVRPGAPFAVPAESEETLHVSVADTGGGVVALTATLNLAYGTGMLAESTGVLLNNEIDDFALAPGVPNEYGLLGGEANAVAGGKRPLSSMTPTIVEAPGARGGGRPLLVLGSPGGSRIITSVLQVLINVIDHRMPLQEAVDAPRFHHQWYPDALSHEPRAFAEDVARALRRRGHVLRVGERPMGNVNAIGLDEDGAWLGAADPRRQGASAGF